MDVIRHLGSQPLMASLQVLCATIAVGFVYSYFTRDQPYPGFPIATIEGKGPKTSWLQHGKQTLNEGLQKVTDHQNSSDIFLD